MFIMGIFALVKGEIKLTKRKVVFGTAARMIGVILMLPLPLTFLVGVGIGLVIVMQGGDQAQAQETAAEVGTLVGVAIPLGCALLAIILGFMLAKPPEVRNEEYFAPGPPKPPSDNPYEPPSNPFSDR